MRKPFKPDKRVPLVQTGSDLSELIDALPPAIRDILKGVQLNVKIDISSFTSSPYETSVMDQVALAGMQPQAAADAIIKVAKEKSQGAFDHVNHDGQAALAQWILKGYFPNAAIPIELMAAIDKRLKPEETKRG